MSTQKVSFSLNGKAVEIDVEDRTLLVHALRETLDMTGTHIGCDTTHCGVCTVDMDGYVSEVLYCACCSGRG